MYYSQFLMLQLRNASSDIVLHFRVGSSDILVFGGCMFLHMSFSVGANTGST